MTHIAWQEPAVQQWLQMAPPFSDVDLGDYYWVARDRISSKLAGISDVPPVVRALTTSLIFGSEAERTDAAQRASQLGVGEQASLLRLMGTRFESNPEVGVFDGLVKLVEAVVPGSVETLAGSLRRARAADMSPMFASTVDRLRTELPDTARHLVPVLEFWAREKTGVGTMAESALRPH